MGHKIIIKSFSNPLSGFYIQLPGKTVENFILGVDEQVEIDIPEFESLHTRVVNINALKPKGGPTNPLFIPDLNNVVEIIKPKPRYIEIDVTIGKDVTLPKLLKAVEDLEKEKPLELPGRIYQYNPLKPGQCSNCGETYSKHLEDSKGDPFWCRKPQIEKPQTPEKIKTTHFLAIKTHGSQSKNNWCANCGKHRITHIGEDLRCKI